MKNTTCFPFTWRDTIDWHTQRLRAVLHISPDSVYLQALLAEQTQVLCKLDSLEFLSPVSWQSEKHCDKQITRPLTLSIKQNTTFVKRHVFHTPVHLTEPITPNGNTYAHQPPVCSSILGPLSACRVTFDPFCRFNDCVWVGFFGLSSAGATRWPSTFQWEVLICWNSLWHHWKDFPWKMLHDGTQTHFFSLWWFEQFINKLCFADQKKTHPGDCAQASISRSLCFRQQDA